MVFPALPLIVVGAAGLAVGWLGRGLARQRGKSEAAVAAGDGPGVGTGRPTRTLPWCPTCQAHMARGHRCRVEAAEGRSDATDADAGPWPRSP
ncbi:MAG: hypothetical protein U1E42_10025 [Rhodospirillales bacterium]